jgi:hypothetical protein
MGLTENEAGRVWTRMAEAEARALYFANLASKYNRYKQIITGVSFFLSSGAAATLIAQLPSWVPILLSLIVAVVTAYSMAIGLDHRIATLTKLHYEWNQLSAEYEHLWNHWRNDDAGEVLDELLRKARDASEIAIEMPYDEGLVKKWSDIAYSRLRPSPALSGTGQ